MLGGLAFTSGQIRAVRTIEMTPNASHAAPEWPCRLVTARQAPPVIAIPAPTPAYTVPPRRGRPPDIRRSSAHAETNTSTHALAAPAAARRTIQVAKW